MRTHRVLLKVAITSSLMVSLLAVGIALASDVSFTWTGHPATYSSSPSAGSFAATSNPASGGNRYHWAWDQWTWWDSATKAWILANQGSTKRYQEALVFHVFKPNSNNACGLGMETNSAWFWTNLPAPGIQTKATCWPVPINEIRIKIGDPSLLLTGSSNQYYAQTKFKDWSPYEEAEVTNDSYWVDTWFGTGSGEYFGKLCLHSSGLATAPSSGLC